MTRIRGRSRRCWLLIVVLLLLHPAAYGDVICNESSSDAPVAEDDSYAFPTAPTLYDVLGNDFDPGGSDITITARSAVSGGTATISSDGKSILFTPAAGASFGGFDYTIRNDIDRTATAHVRLGDPAATGTLGVRIESNCDGTYCTFRSIPDVTTGIRAYSWMVYSYDPVNNRVGALEQYCAAPEWKAGPAYGCTLSSTGWKAVAHSVLYHNGQVAVTTPDRIVAELGRAAPQVSWTLDNPGNGLFVRAVINSTTAPNPLNHQYSVDWGDGSPVDRFAAGQGDYRGSTLTHTYVTPGLKTVTVTHQQSGTGQAKFANVQNAPPRPAITARQYANESFNIEVQTAGIDEFGPDSFGNWSPQSPVKWELDLGDGTSVILRPETGESPFVAHTYPSKKATYKARLQVTDHLGAVGTAEAEVAVTNARPVAKVDFSCQGTFCRFDGSRSSDDDGTVRDWLWTIYNLANGGTWYTSTSQTPILEIPFLPLGEFEVRLSVKDNNGQQSATAASRFGWAPPVSDVPTVFYAVEPCSLGTLSSWADPATPTVFRYEAAAAGRCGMPADLADVQAVAVNVRLSNVTGSGYVWDAIAGTGMSVIQNFSNTRPVQSNFTTLRVHRGGIGYQLALGAKVFATPPSAPSLALDVVGYFRRASAAPVLQGSTVGPLWFQPLDPCVLFDTRQEPPALSAGTARTFLFKGRCGVTVPDSVALLGVAAVTPSAAGRITIASPSSSTTTSSIDFTTSRTVSQAAVAKLANGSVRASTNVSSTGLVLQTPGVFTPAPGLEYYGLQWTCRVLDSRQARNDNARFQNGVAQPFQVRGNCGVDVRAAAVLLAATVVNADGPGHLQFFGSGRDVPNFGTVNFAANEAISGSAVVPLGDDVNLNAIVRLFGGTSADVIVDVVGFFAERTNVAAAANGATVFASTTFGTGTPASAMINGDRRGIGWGQGTGGWQSAANTVSFVEVHFPATKLIDEISLFTYGGPTDLDPTESYGFTQYGLTDFDIGYWDAGANAWRYLPAVTGNRSLWRRFRLPQPVRTQKLSIVARRGMDSHARIVEIEAYEASPPPLP